MTKAQAIYYIRCSERLIWLTSRAITRGCLWVVDTSLKPPPCSPATVICILERVAWACYEIRRQAYCRIKSFCEILLRSDFFRSLDVIYRAGKASHSQDLSLCIEPSCILIVVEIRVISPEPRSLNAITRKATIKCPTSWLGLKHLYVRSRSSRSYKIPTFRCYDSLSRTTDDTTLLCT